MNLLLYALLCAIDGIVVAVLFVGLSIHRKEVLKNPTLPNGAGKAIAWACLGAVIIITSVLALTPPCSCN